LHSVFREPFDWKSAVCEARHCLIETDVTVSAQRRVAKAYLTVCRATISEHGPSRRAFPRPQQKACEKCGLEALGGGGGGGNHINSKRRVRSRLASIRLVDGALSAT